jgi:hypothetical protein
MQHYDQCAVALVLIVPPQHGVEIVDPCMGQLNCVIDAFQSDGAHGLSRSAIQFGPVILDCMNKEPLELILLK